MSTSKIGSLLASWRAALRAVPAANGGNTAVIFALAMIPICGAVGAAVDYSRANSVKSSMQAALDSAALVIAREAANLPSDRINARANELLSANFHRPEARDVQVAARYEVHDNAYTLTLKGSAKVEAAFVRLLGVSQLKVSTLTQVTWGAKELELALVLDNTGSMRESGKIEALKKAAHELLRTLRQAAPGAGRVKVAIVPFDTHVNIGPAEADQPWIDWTYDSPTPSFTLASWSGSNGSASRRNWTGCIVDREQPYDVRNSAPRSDPATFFPAVNCNLSPLLPLTSDWRALENKVDAMKASGNTNLTIGLVWGWTMLTPGAPLSEARAADPKREKVIVFLTDGLNTENRWSRNSGEIDRRTREVCRNINASGIRTYTIRVIEGNASLLKSCASKPEMYFEVRRASELSDVFAAIARDLSDLRLSR